MLFVFYSSLILYYSAAFTREWGVYCDYEVMPLPHASGYKITSDDEPAPPKGL
ncbi:MAG: hypothetical protein K9G49_01615 [Taibaiella sp.]|nr:hypothetical protein [Taibaiella sp.]